MVGCRRISLTAFLHLTLSKVSASFSLQAFMSLSTHCFQVLRGLPGRFLSLSTSTTSSVTVFLQPCERYHLRRQELELNTFPISAKPSLDFCTCHNKFQCFFTSFLQLLQVWGELSSVRFLIHGLVEVWFLLFRGETGGTFRSVSLTVFTPCFMVLGIFKKNQTILN